MGETVRKLGPGKLVIATHNSGKLKEISDLISPYQIVAVAAGDIALEEPEETEKTFAGNAALKARAAAEASGLPSLADDSGLAVTALGGAPGIYSARWAGQPRDFNAAMAKVEAALAEAGTEDFSARFVCVLCVAWPDGEEAFFEGDVRGTLRFPPRGDKGFGYDPIFVPEGYESSFGEMAPSEKRALSHRARAFDKFTATCLEQ